MSRICTSRDSGCYRVEPVGKDLLSLCIVPVLQRSVDQGGDPAKWRPDSDPVIQSAYLVHAAATTKLTGGASPRAA